MLRKIMKTKQEIIHKSKNLAFKLYSLKSLPFNTGEMKILYFISGNVVAFYPNIDIQKAYHIASDYLIDYCSSFRGEFNLDWVE